MCIRTIAMLITEPTPTKLTVDGRATHKPVQSHDSADYDDLLAAYDLVLLEFVTSGCGICASMEPVLTGVARSVPASWRR